MSMVPMTHYPLIGEVLTPTHIGDGTTLTPLEYLVKGRQVIRFRLEALLYTLSEAEQEEVKDYLESDMMTFREWVKQQFEERAEEEFPPGMIISQSEMSKSSYRLYREMGHALELHPFIHHSLEGTPYIPGSSLKGALRTAVIDQQANKKLRAYSFWHDPKAGFRNDRNFEFSRKALGCGFFSTDPFRAIRIRDALVWKNRTRYLSVYNFERNQEGHLSGHKSTLLHLETLQPGLMFTSILSIATSLQKMSETVKKKEKLLSLELSAQDFIQSCQNYYSPQVIEAEMERFFKFYPEGQEHLKIVLETAYHLAPNQFLLRIGRYSHFEYKSARAFRVLQDMNHFVPTRDGCSRSLGEFCYPMGWLKMTLLKPGEVRSDDSKGDLSFLGDLHVLRNKLHVFQTHQQARRQVIRTHQESLARLEAERAAKLRQEQEEIEQKLADEAQRRAKMTPLEMSIEEVIHAHPTQADHITLLQALAHDYWESDEDKKAVALLIREHMQTIKIWKEISYAKKPDKDKNYQRTQEVMKYINK